jgi:hypothetical protein
MTTTIKAPATMGATVELTGDTVGSFLVHRSTQPTFIDNDLRFLWSVTHIATGMRFPFQFFQKNAARGFAKDAEALMKWSTVKVEVGDPTKTKGEWVAGAPTKEQIAAIHAAAAARGAYVP